MHLIRFVPVVLACLLFAGPVRAEDRIETKEGKVYKGAILFHNDTQFYMRVGTEIVRVNIADISEILFEPKLPEPPAPDDSGRKVTLHQ